MWSMTSFDPICAAMQESDFQRRSDPVEDNRERVYAATQCHVERQTARAYFQGLAGCIPIQIFAAVGKRSVVALGVSLAQALQSDAIFAFVSATLQKRSLSRSPSVAARVCDTGLRRSIADMTKCEPV
jgi:hypothetical protein